MKKNGFTLVELLGVIVILGLIMVLVLPKIINSVKSSTKDTDEVTKKLILEAAEMYVDNSNYFLKIDGNKYTITLRQLVDAGYLKAPVKMSNGEDITDSKCVEVAYENGYIYQVKDTCVETKNPCILVSGVAKAYGSKYACYVNDTTQYNFYVLGDNEDGTTNLIMERNICENGTVATDTNTCLEIYGMTLSAHPWSYAAGATSSWTNTTYEYKFDYETEIVDEDGPLVEHFTSDTARIASRDEVSNASASANNQFLYEYLAPQSEWIDYCNILGVSSWIVSAKGEMPTNNVSGIPCYWLIEYQPAAGAYSGFLAGADGVVTYNTNRANGTCGVRPVITVDLN